MKLVPAKSLKYLPAGHEDPKHPGVWKKVLLTRDDLPPGRLQMLNWCKLPPKSSFQNHYHQAMTEVFICLKGNATFHIGQDQLKFTTGDLVIVPEKTPHQMVSTSRQNVYYLALGIVTQEGGKTILVK